MSENGLSSELAIVEDEEVQISEDQPLYDLLMGAENDKNSLQEKINALYDEIQQIRTGNPNLHRLQIQANKEKEYWDLQEKLQELSNRIGEIESVIGLYDSGEFSLTDAMSSLGVVQEAPRLSKKKIAIQREREFLNRAGISPDSTMPVDLSFISGTSLGVMKNPTHITTGRHQRTVKNPDPMDPQGDFFYRTADTHGGKVGHGKKRYKR